MMTRDPSFTIRQTRFDENYTPEQGTRLTTNFANLARGAARRDNLRNVLRMIDRRFNDLAYWDNPQGDRYAVELDIISVEMDIEGNGAFFPAIELLKTTILDHRTNTRQAGIIGNNFSSYVRDYDFSVLLPAHNRNSDRFTIPENFGVLHGRIFRSVVQSEVFKAHFPKPPVICLSVSENRTYTRTTNRHPVLGAEYQPDGSSLTELYFRKMGMEVRYFMPPKSVAPLAFYFLGDLLNEYSNLELISTLSTMEAFQKIYRPEIYNANAAAGQHYKPSLKHADYSTTRVVYDREERARLATEQGHFTGENFIRPYKAFLDHWSAQDLG